MLKAFIADNHLDLDSLFKKHANRTTLAGPDTNLTYLALANRICQVTDNLQSLSQPAGLKIGLYTEDPIISPILMMATWQVGAVFVPFDINAPLDSLLSIVKPDILVTDQPLPGGQVDLIIHPDKLMDGSSATNRARPGLRPLNLDAEASVILTSGSSGTPKGVVHTIGNYIYSAWGTIDQLSLSPGDSWLASLPLFHVGGLMIFVRTLLSGAMAILPENRRELEETITRDRPSFLSLVPTQLMRYLDQPDLIYALQNCRGILLGGAAAPEWLLRKSFSLNIPVLPTYGSTESCAQATGVAPYSTAEERFTSGKPLRFRTIRLDEEQNIVIGGQTIFKHYLHQNKPVAPEHHQEFKTSDIGRLDNSGNLIVLGRSDMVFQSGGENINPLEIEAALAGEEGILTAVVVPVPHPEFGQVPWAFVQTQQPLDPDLLKESLKKRLSGYKIPKKILPLPAEDTAEGMKPDRQRLKQLAADILQAGD